MRRLLDAFVAWLSRVVTRLYFGSVELEGFERFPRGAPTIVVANHHNAILDALLLIGHLPVHARFIAASSLWRDPLMKHFVRLAGVLPVQRKQDAGAPADNTRMFSAVREELRRGGSIGLFPEGETHDAPFLLEPKTGAARMALDAMAGGAAPSLRIVPIGLHYDHKDRFRSRALVSIGEPLDPSPEAALDDSARAIRGLTARIGDALRLVGPDFTSWTEQRLLTLVSSIFLAPQPELPTGATLADVTATARRLAVRYRSLRTKQPERVATLERDVRSYDRLLAQTRLRDRQVASSYPAFGVLGFAIRAIVTVTAGLPVAVAGLLISGLPYWICGRLARRAPERDEVSTHKLFAGLVLLPLFWAAEAAAAGAFAGLRMAAVTAVAAPLTAFVALRVVELARALWEEGRGYVLLRTRTSLARHLKERRDALYRELSALVAGSR
jgi:1-acyl-sn-glycerol-3-phosphate acyltransferase